MKNSQNSQTIDNEYAIRRNEAIQKLLTEKDKFTWQQHHDYYVKKRNEAVSSKTKLSESEQNQYDLAILREKQGLVKPLV